MDLAQLEIRVRAVEAAQAKQTLDQLAASGAKAEQATTGLSRGAQAMAAQFGRLTAGITAVAGGLAAFHLASRTFQFASQAVIGMNSTLEKSQIQFTNLLGSADAARAHVAELFKLGAETPFETGPIIEASRLLLTFGGQALATRDNLVLVGDAAAGAGRDITQVSFWFGRLFSQLQSGQKGLAEVINPLVEMGIVSGQTRTELIRLAEQGGQQEKIWAKVREEFQRFQGQMKNLSGTWEGLTSTISDNVNMLLASALKPLFDVMKDILKQTADLAQSKDVENWAKGAAVEVRSTITSLTSFAKEVRDLHSAMSEMRIAGVNAFEGLGAAVLLLLTRAHPLLALATIIGILAANWERLNNSATNRADIVDKIKAFQFQLGQLEKPNLLRDFFMDDEKRSRKMAEIQTKVSELTQALDAMTFSLDGVGSGFKVVDTQTALTQSSMSGWVQVTKEAGKANVEWGKATEEGGKAAARAAKAIAEARAELLAENAVYKQVIAGTLTLEQGMEKLAIAREAARVGSHKLAEENLRLKKAAEDTAKADELIAQKAEELQRIRAQEAKAVLETTQALEKQTQANIEEARVIEDAIANGRNYDDVLRDIAIRHAEVELSAKGVRENIHQLAVASVDAATSLEKSRKALDAIHNAPLLGTRDIDSVITGVLENGPKKLDDVAESIGQTMGIRLVKGILLGKSQDEQAILGNFNQLLGIGAAGIFGKEGFNLGSLLPSNILGGVNANSGSLIGGLQGMFSSTGILGSVFSQGGQAAGQAFAGGATDAANAAFLDGIFGTDLTGVLQQSGTAAGVSFGQVLGLAAAQAMVTSFLVDLAGGGSGAKWGAIAGGLLGGPLGGIFGGFIGSLFDNTPNKGTQIRKEIKDFLEEISASFESEVKSGRYFFEETKKLGKQMFPDIKNDGKQFLAASKVVLEREVGPELARQLSALGTFLTAEAAIKLGKNVEQTGTTFGNMLVANLGLERIPGAIAEIIEKADIGFGDVVGKLTSVFRRGEIGVDFYKNAILGAVDLFADDLPAAIDVTREALSSFTREGIFSMDKFQENIENALTNLELLANAADIIGQARSRPEGLVGLDLGASFVGNVKLSISEAIMQGIQDGFLKAALNEAALAGPLIAIREVIRQFVAGEMTGPVATATIKAALMVLNPALERLGDLWREIGASTPELLASLGLPQITGEAEQAADKIEELTEKIKELREELARLPQRMINVQIDLAQHLASVGQLTPAQGLNRQWEGLVAQFSALQFTQEREGETMELTQEQIDLVKQGQRVIVERFNAEKAAIEAARDEQIKAIEDQTKAIKEFYEQQRETIQDRLDFLNEEKQQIQDVARERLDALRKELDLAKSFRQAAESIAQTIAGIAGGSGVPKNQQLAFFEAQEARLRARLATARPEEQAALMQQIAESIQSQLGVGLFQPGSQQAINQREAALTKLAVLQEEAVARSANLENIEAQMLAIETEQEARLKIIDAEIKAQNALLKQISDEEKGALAQAQIRAEAAINDAKRVAEVAIMQLRHEAVGALNYLATLETDLLARQERILTRQLQATEQELITLVGINQYQQLMADQGNVQIALQSQMLQALNIMTSQLNAIIPAAGGAHEDVRGPKLFLAHAGERVDIDYPSYGPAQGGRNGKSGGDIIINLSAPASFETNVESHEGEPFDPDRMTRAQRSVLVHWLAEELGPTIKREVREAVKLKGL